MFSLFMNMGVKGVNWIGTLWIELKINEFNSIIFCQFEFL